VGDLWRPLHLLSILRFVASAGLLILPTTLMGATLPILARYFVSRPFELGRVSLRLGTLYAFNLFAASRAPSSPVSSFCPTSA